MSRWLSETETGAHRIPTPCPRTGRLPETCPRPVEGRILRPARAPRHPELALAEPAPDRFPGGAGLPALPPVRVRGRPRARPSPRPARRLLAGRLVLVVEDDDDARRINRTMLEHHGASVVTASSAGDAVLRLLVVRPDAMVVDLRMPDMDGFELVRQLRADPHWQHLPIVALSALGSDEAFRRTFEDGFDAHLTKPVDDSVLASVVFRVMGR